MAAQIALHRILGIGMLAAGLSGFLGLAGDPAQAYQKRSDPPAAATQAAAGVEAAPSIGDILERAGKGEIKADANVYIAPERVRQYALLEAYAADTAPKVKDAGMAVPGLLGIAAQAYRAQNPKKRGDPAYSLADAMRDAMWRKKTAARLKALFGARAPALRTE